MPDILISDAELDAAFAEVAEASEARGYQRGRAEAARLVEFAAGLNGSTHAVIKALRGEDDESMGTGTLSSGVDRVRDSGKSGSMADASPLDQAESEGVQQDIPASEVVMLALCDVLADAKLHGSDGGPVAEYLAGLLDDPEAASEAVEEGRANLPSLPEYDEIHKAFDESLHPRDDSGRFIGRESIHAAKSDPALAEKLREKTTDPEERKKLDAALAGESDTGRTKAGLHRDKVAAAKAEKAKSVNRARELANDISTARRGGEPVPPEHFKELATLLPTLSVQELRSVRGKLAASFFNRTKREDLVTALVRHAKVRAEQLMAENAADDPLDFGMEAMTGDAARGGTGRHGEDELNPWRKGDKASDTRHGEHQHGGRIEQRKQVMDAVADGAKTSHGTPDMGSVLKHGIGRPEETPDDIESHLPAEKPGDKEKAEKFAATLRDAVVDVSGGDTKDWCVSVAEAVKSAYPDAEVWSGGYEGMMDDQAHTIIRHNGYFIDVTADQFGGPEVYVSRDLDENLYPEFRASSVSKPIPESNLTPNQKKIVASLRGKPHHKAVRPAKPIVPKVSPDMEEVT